MYLKLQPYIKSSVAIRSNHKLSFRFFGPYRILQKVGKVAHKLDLPADVRIHSVVHVSQLNKCISPQVQVSSDLSSIPVDFSAELVPIAQGGGLEVDATAASPATIKLAPAKTPSVASVAVIPGIGSDNATFGHLLLPRIVINLQLKLDTLNILTAGQMSSQCLHQVGLGARCRLRLRATQIAPLVLHVATFVVQHKVHTLQLSNLWSPFVLSFKNSSGLDLRR